MRKSVSMWVTVIIAVVVIVGFFCISTRLVSTTDELSKTLSANNLRLSDLQGEQTELNNTLKTVGTDAFIEQQARTLYGYMMPDEIRFVLSNPEILEIQDQIPSP